MIVEKPEDKLEGILNCSICLEPFRQPMRCNDCNNNFCVSCVDNLYAHQVASNRRYRCPLCRSNSLPVTNFEIMRHLGLIKDNCEVYRQDIDIGVDTYNALQKINLGKIESFLASIDLLEPESLSISNRQKVDEK